MWHENRTYIDISTKLNKFRLTVVAVCLFSSSFYLFYATNAMEGESTKRLICWRHFQVLLVGRVYRKIRSRTAPILDVLTSFC